MTSEFVHVGTCAPGGRLHTSINGRYISVIRPASSSSSSNPVYAIDSTCYHFGGPLALGEIEDVNGEPCLVCPWHSYPVSMRDGSKLYQGLEFAPGTKTLVPSGWKKKENAQRVHQVEVRGPNNDVYVKLSSLPCESDTYAMSSVCGERVASGDSKGMARGKDGSLPPRSGHVLAASGAPSVPLFKADPYLTSEVLAASVTDHEIQLTLKDPYPSTGSSGFGVGIMTNSADLLKSTAVDLRMGELHRPYTSLPGAAPGTLRFAVRVAAEGNMSRMLTTLAKGSKIELLKPSKIVAVDASDEKALRDAGVLPQSLRHVVLVSGGSGVAVSVTLAHRVKEQTGPQTQISLICVDHNEDTAMLREEIPKLLGERAQVHRIFTKRRDAEKRAGEASVSYWEGHRPQSLIEYLPKDLGASSTDQVLVCVCGPASFVASSEDIIKSAAGLVNGANCRLVRFVG